MSFALVKLIIEGRGARTPGELAVLVALANRLNEQTGACFPALATIAREARVTTRGADGILRELEKRGLVTITGRGRARSYELHESRLEMEAPSESEVASEQAAISGTPFRGPEPASKLSERSSTEQRREQRNQQRKIGVCADARPPCDGTCTSQRMHANFHSGPRRLTIEPAPTPAPVSAPSEVRLERFKKRLLTMMAS